MADKDQQVGQVKEAIVNDGSVRDEGGFRYAAYANRIRTILLASHRYVAYTSDIGESFRPVAHPYLVSLGYGVSWLYILGDVSYHAWQVGLKSEGRLTPELKPWNYPYPPANPAASQAFKASHDNKLSETDWRVAALKRGLFQSIASMGLPAFTIHSTVRYSSLLFKNTKNRNLRVYGPVGIGLGVVPLLPYIFDEPCEAAIDWLFDKGEEFYKSRSKLA